MKRDDRVNIDKINKTKLIVDKISTEKIKIRRLLENIRDANHKFRFITKKRNSKLFWVEKNEDDSILDTIIIKKNELKYKYLSWKSVKINDEYIKVNSLLETLFNNKINRKVDVNMIRNNEVGEIQNQ